MTFRQSLGLFVISLGLKKLGCKVRGFHNGHYYCLVCGKPMLSVAYPKLDRLSESIKERNERIRNEAKRHGY